MKTWVIWLGIAAAVITVIDVILWFLWRGAKYAYEHKDEIARKEHEERGWIFPD